MCSTVYFFDLDTRDSLFSNLFRRSKRRNKVAPLSNSPYSMSTLHEGDGSSRRERSSRHRTRASRSHRYCRMVSLWCACAKSLHEDVHFVYTCAWLKSQVGEMLHTLRCGSQCVAGVVTLHLQFQTIQSLCTVLLTFITYTHCCHPDRVL